MKHVTLNNISLFLLTVTLLFLTLHIPQTIYSQEDFRHVELGLPFRFIIQDQGITPPLPWNTSLESVQENPIKIIWPQFLIDIVLVFGLLKFFTRFYYLNRMIKFMQYTLPLGVFLFYFFSILLIMIESICCTPEVHLSNPTQDQNFSHDSLPSLSPNPKTHTPML